MNASIHLRTNALQGVPGASAVVRGKVAAGSVAPAAASLASRAEKVAAVAAEHAAAVDRNSRFPAEAMAAARAECLMGIAVPTRARRRRRRHRRRGRCLLRARARLRPTAHDLCDASDQGRVLVRHGRHSAWHRACCAGCAEQIAARLLDHRRSGRRRCPQQRGADRARGFAHCARAQSNRHLLRRGRPTALSPRRGARADAASTDQVLVVFVKQDYALERLSGWDTLGMRGTCSAGFKLTAPRAPRADPARSLRQDPRPDHDAGRAPRRGAAPGPASRPARSSAPALSCARPRARGRQLPPWRGALHARQRLAAHAAQPDRRLR